MREGESAFLLNRVQELAGGVDRGLHRLGPLFAVIAPVDKVPRCAHANHKQSQAGDERDRQYPGPDTEPRSEHRHTVCDIVTESGLRSR